MDQRQAERVGDVLLGDRDPHRCLAVQSDRSGAAEDERDEIGGAFERGAAADAEQVFVQHALLPRGDPGDIVGEPRMVTVELVQIFALEDAEQHRRQCLDGMLHLAHQAALQPDEISWHGIVQDLAAPVRQQFVAEGPAGKHRVEMGAVAALDQDSGALVDGELALLERADKGKFLLFEFAKDRQWPERTLLAWIPAAGKGMTILARHFDPSSKAPSKGRNANALRGSRFPPPATGMSFLHVFFK
ncbi:hypothetical protein MESS4_280071 [Mesorhizobium sp. STM 4661]|nr:hypothetical protein MESS4_280071 [Mesorhizobium sp. STM 4661]